MASYDTLITDARAFFKELDANNTRDWWQEHKSTYDTKLKAPALALLEEVCSPLAKLTDHNVTSKLFRPHHDVRFSKDKTPYNTHLHMMWQVAAGAPQNPVFFFGIGQGYVSVGAGMMGFDKPVLTNWRKMVDLDTARITGIVQQLEDQGFSLREPALKRVPPPFDKDHPAGRLLRMKGVTASREMTGKGPLPDQLLDNCRSLWPLNDLLISIAEA
ncbi:TIGR02453 family protein [Loktanella sp. Alg231-35]|uniref:TIGR02453 family protein n=1 Tax=Loktanella sp. Alg231-35 TaxID=1922220 RepID=UPI00131EE145|nr:TIGR02453 family protein [Loktanella sp. Alg231-35]